MERLITRLAQQLGALKVDHSHNSLMGCLFSIVACQPWLHIWCWTAGQGWTQMVLN